MDRLLAEIEPTLQRAPGSLPPTAAALKATLFSPSGYMAALPPESVASGETLVPGTATATSPERPGALEPAAIPNSAAGRQVPTTTGAPTRARMSAAEAPTGEVARPGPRRARGLLLALGAIVVVSMIGVALGIALTRRPSRTAPASADAAVPAAPDAAAPPVDAASAADAPAAADARAPDAPPAPPAPLDAGIRVSSPGPKKLLEHLQAAEDALRAGNTIRYLYWSEAAHRADPRDVRARMMYADALIMTGSKERGCAELRALKRIPAARTRASDAGCPTD
jgi:hypothetical protein